VRSRAQPCARASGTAVTAMARSRRAVLVQGRSNEMAVSVAGHGSPPAGSTAVSTYSTRLTCPLPLLPLKSRERVTEPSAPVVSVTVSAGQDHRPPARVYARTVTSTRAPPTGSPRSFVAVSAADAVHRPPLPSVVADRQVASPGPAGAGAVVRTSWVGSSSWVEWSWRRRGGPAPPVSSRADGRRRPRSRDRRGAGGGASRPVG
jgi:hypothetical protein